jgi:hypothetical protein
MAENETVSISSGDKCFPFFAAPPVPERCAKGFCRQCLRLPDSPACDMKYQWLDLFAMLDAGYSYEEINRQIGRDVGWK